MKTIIQSLWIGSELSPLEIMAINSHLYYDHEFHLYLYHKTKYIPSNVVVKDGREILPEQDIFSYQQGPGKGSVSAFSNVFRYKLLRDKGGWWCDLDVVCQQNFSTLNQTYVFASERNKFNQVTATTCVIKLPKQSLLADQCYQFARNIDRMQVQWGEIGPNLFNTKIKETNLSKHISSPNLFCPINWFDIDCVLQSIPLDTQGCCAIHLWNEMWRRKGLDKNTRPKIDCLYQQLRNKYCGKSFL